MSKAFTRESDDAPDLTAFTRPASSLPPGTKNYLTASGERRLREELTRLIDIDRPPLVATPDDPDARHRLQLVDQRMAQIKQILHSAVVVPLPAVPEDRVRFGATVTLREQDGTESKYRLVGVDEVDIDQGCISWLSPLAKALLNARRGDRVKFKFPSGEEQLEILSVVYE